MSPRGERGMSTCFFRGCEQDHRRRVTTAMLALDPIEIGFDEEGCGVPVGEADARHARQRLPLNRQANRTNPAEAG